MSYTYSGGTSSSWAPHYPDGSSIYHEQSIGPLEDAIEHRFTASSGLQHDSQVLSHRSFGYSLPRSSDPRSFPAPQSQPAYTSLYRPHTGHASLHYDYRRPHRPTQEPRADDRTSGAQPTDTELHIPERYVQPHAPLPEPVREVGQELAELRVDNGGTLPRSSDVVAAEPTSPSDRPGTPEQRYLQAISPSCPVTASIVPENDGLLYKEFKSRRQDSRKFFVTGKVFRCLWTEPAYRDEASLTGTGVTGKAWTQNAYGEWTYSKVRIFVVVREGRVDCQAAPVTSYGGKGVAKANVKKSDHAIIYSGKEAPKATPQEAPGPSEHGMQTFAIRVDPDLPGTKLDIMSRIDFGRPCTIHNYMKVKSLGKVNRKSMQNLITQYRTVQSDSGFAALMQASQPLQSPKATMSRVLTSSVLHHRTIEAVQEWMAEGGDLDDIIQQIRVECGSTVALTQPSNGANGE